MKKVFLLCNAHLDPVWQWEWEEGAAETLSTFRIAAKFCREYDGFVFNHNEVLLYQWVEEYEPELFKEIQELVKEGKWHIMGGWHLQPDCNMPSGEALIRQIQSGREYFKEKFDKTPTTAINFDPFGHNRGLIQIMKKCGFDSYLFMRPYKSQLTLPAEEFKWVGFDGSYVYARRTGAYNSPKGRATEKIKTVIDKCKENDIELCLWGVGNHGGGPSKKDLDMIAELQKECKKEGVELIHSTPEEYFEEVKKKDIPEFFGELNPAMVGCYTSMIRVKQQYRQLENMLFMTEKMCASACANGLMEYPEKEINEAIHDMNTVQFHDLLPGTSIREGEEVALRKIYHGMEILSRIRLKAFVSLTSGQKTFEEDKIPIMIYNPHPYKIEGDFECEMMLWDQNWAEEFSYPKVYKDGELLPTQSEKERSNLNLDWRKKVVFHGTLEPMQMNRFDCGFIKVPARPKAEVKNDENYFYLENERVFAKISKKTGFIESYKVDGIELLKGACELQVYNDDCDPWGMNVISFPEKIGEFKIMTSEEVKAFAGIGGNLEAVHPIESGAVRNSVESILKYKDSKAIIKYTLSERDTAIKIAVNVIWNETQRMVKLSLPANINDGKVFGQVSYGVEKFEKNTMENCAQKYVYIKNDENALGIINNGTYGFSKEDETIYLSLLRSASYCAHPINDRPIIPNDRYSLHMDLGERSYEFMLVGGKDAEIEIAQRAQIFNERPMSVSVYPNERKDKVKNLLTATGDEIEVSAIKKAENGYIVRLFNPFNYPTNINLNSEILKADGAFSLNPYEIKTVKITDGNIKECDFLEK